MDYEVQIKTLKKEVKDLKKNEGKIKLALSSRAGQLAGLEAKVDALAQECGKAFTQINGMRYALATIIKKGLITEEEVNKHVEEIYAEANSNETPQPSESGDVQSEGLSSTKSS